MCWKPGMKGVCITSGEWYYEKPSIGPRRWLGLLPGKPYLKETGPAMGEVVHVEGVAHEGCLVLRGYPDVTYRPWNFRPLDELEEQLENIEKDHVVEPEPALA